MELQWRITTPYIPPHRTQVHPRMQGLSSKPINNKTKVVISIAFVLMVPSVYYLFATAQKVHQSSNFAAEFHSIVMDSDSNSARVHVFRWLGEEHLPFVDYIKVSNSKSKSKSIQALIDFAKSKVPKKDWVNTKVQLFIINSIGEKENNFLQECRQLLRASGFAFKDAWVRVARRQDKGIYAWIAANYALGTLGAKPQQTTGILQLDAASLQVTFAVKESPLPQSSQSIKFAGVTYNLYSQSLPQFGQDAAWELLHELQNSIELKAFSNSSRGLVDNPCIPKGYELTTNTSDKKLTFHAAGNFSACRSEALALLAKRRDKCLHPPCQILSSFLELRSKPVSPENFLYTSEFLVLVPWASLPELESLGRHYCEDDWDKLKIQHHSIDDLDMLRYCFFSAYTVALLHDSLGIPMHDKRIAFSNNAGSVPLDWTLGAFIFQSMLDTPELEVDNLDQIVGNESVTYLSLFAFLVIALLAAYFVVQWRKPQLKTIYDLEKGHYIVTRMPS